MLTFLKKNKFILLTNLFIIISYIFISSKPELFGLDDIKANSYIYNPQFTFMDNINRIFFQAENWNVRIGEILYYIIGCFPRWVYFILNSITITIFFNLVFFYFHGINYKKNLYNKKYLLSILIMYLITLVFYPAFSETIIWMAGAFNHIWDTVIVLLIGIPFRLLIDKYDVFIKYKKTKYLFFIGCILAGYSTEHLVPWLLIYMLLTTIISYKRNRTTSWHVHSILIVLISFISMVFHNSTIIRVQHFQKFDWALNTKKIMFSSIFNNYKYILFLIIILLIILIIQKILYKNKKCFKNFILSILHLILSFVSIAVLYFAPYFMIRVTTLIYFFMLVLIINIIDNIIFKEFLMKILLFISIILIIFFSVKLNRFYDDFNDFNKIRYNFIKEQIKSKKSTIKCPIYDNKLNYFFVERLVSYEGNYCDSEYLKFLFNVENITVEYYYEQIR